MQGVGRQTLLLLDWCVGRGVCAMAELVLGGQRLGGLCPWPEWPQGPCGLQQSGPCSVADLHSVAMSSPPRVQPPVVPGAWLPQGL